MLISRYGVALNANQAGRTPVFWAVKAAFIGIHGESFGRCVNEIFVDLT